MAITQLLSKDNNEYKFDFVNTYFKIDDLYINTIKESIRIGVRGYPNQYSRQNSGIGIYKKVLDIKFSDITITSFDKNSLLTACYIYLKTLDEFKNGIDC